MAELLTASVLSDDEKAIVNRLSAKIRRDAAGLQRLDRYYDGEQRVDSKTGKSDDGG